MKKNPVIKPDVLNILWSTSESDKKVDADHSPQPEARPSRWDKVKGFIKKAWGYIVPAIAILTPALNAISRLRESTKRPHPRRNNKGCNYNRGIAWAG